MPRRRQVWWRRRAEKGRYCQRHTVLGTPEVKTGSDGNCRHYQVPVIQIRHLVPNHFCNRKTAHPKGCSLFHDSVSCETLSIVGRQGFHIATFRPRFLDQRRTS